MSVPQSAEEWAAVVGELARFRAGRDPEHFPAALGIDNVEALREWASADAIDTLPLIGMSAESVTAGAVASALATHFQMGLEVGLYLAASGRVSP